LFFANKLKEKVLIDFMTPNVTSSQWNWWWNICLFYLILVSWKLKCVLLHY